MSNLEPQGMFRHLGTLEDQVIIGPRPNPLTADWHEWTLVVYPHCKALSDWHPNSEEQVNGGNLEITAVAPPEHAQHIYCLSAADE